MLLTSLLVLVLIILRVVRPSETCNATPTPTGIRFTLVFVAVSLTRLPMYCTFYAVQYSLHSDSKLCDVIDSDEYEYVENATITIIIPLLSKYRNMKVKRMATELRP